MQQRTAKSRFTRSGGVVFLSVGLCAVLGVAAVMFSSMLMSVSHSSVPDPVVVESLLLEVGLSPEALATAGVSQAQTTALVTAAAEYVESHDEAIAAARSKAMSDAAACRAALQKVRTGTASQGEKDALDGLESAMNTSQAAWNATLDGLFEAATEGVTGTSLEQLAKIRAAARWGVGMPYKVITRTDEQWVALHRALRAKAVADRLETELAEPHASVLSNADAFGAVSQAQSRLASDGQAITTAYSNALASE